MPIYEFSCSRCGHRFEELVGSHVGTASKDVRCPECGASNPERLVSSSYSPVPRQLTPAQKRRLEAKRGIDRGGAKQRFKHQRAAGRHTGGGRDRRG
jgi:putative FmdB family regulatory protein